eukprot:CAMPEP_0184504366 /NCGR_PEP_ID=MMETSP0113_2-20130426/52428_1 /TAXON_ID=91329 /ORGANISM="Norrisiella sphaerica, Strain BC52" /LENGTH=477 /DNA_ID=CAMNT_0026894007 /DNA_START=733 /DNA_END=2166 /DNA_ORIENTATION=+
MNATYRRTLFLCGTTLSSGRVTPQDLHIIFSGFGSVQFAMMHPSQLGGMVCFKEEEQMAHAYAAARWRKIIDVSVSSINANYSRMLDKNIRLESTWLAWTTTQQHMDKWVHAFDDVVNRAKEQKMIEYKEEVMNNTLARYRFAVGPDRQALRKRILSLFPRWIRNRQARRPRVKKTNMTVQDINKEVEEVMEKEGGGRMFQGFKLHDDFYRFQLVEKMKEEMREVRDMARQPRSSPLAGAVARERTAIEEEKARIVQELMEQAQDDEEGVDERYRRLTTPKLIKEGWHIKPKNLSGVAASDTTSKDNLTQQRYVMGLPVMDYQPTMEIGGKIYPMPRTLEDYKKLMPLAEVETKEYVKKNAEIIHEYRKSLGIRGQNELDYLNVLHGKRGKAYLKRPAHIRRRQRRRYIVVGKETDRKVVREKHGDNYYGAFGESSNPWRQGDEETIKEFGGAPPPNPLKSRIDEIQKRYARRRNGV